MSLKKKIAQELAERIGGGDDLAMDYAARMKRADISGFNKDVYHGSLSDIDEFNSGITYTSSNPDVASDFALYKTRPVQKGANVSKLKLKGNYLEVDADYSRESIREAERRFGEQTLGITPDEYPNGMEIYDHARKEGFDGVVFKGVVDDAGAPHKAIPSDVYATFDPSNIRSVNAAFDPSKKGSSNLLASLGAGTAVGAGMLSGVPDVMADAVNDGTITAQQARDSIPNQDRVIAKRKRDEQQAYQDYITDLVNQPEKYEIKGARQDIRGMIAGEIAERLRAGERVIQREPLFKPLEMMYPTGLSNFFENIQYGEKNKPSDYIDATLDLI